MSRFSGKRVLVTGGTSGMGLAGARRISAEGGTVVVTGLDAGRIEAARQLLPEGSLVLGNDAADPAAASALADAVRDREPLDGLWLNAATAATARRRRSTPAPSTH